MTQSIMSIRHAPLDPFTNILHLFTPFVKGKGIGGGELTGDLLLVLCFVHSVRGISCMNFELTFII
jgi:hypothetical protein